MFGKRTGNDLAKSQHAAKSQKLNNPADGSANAGSSTIEGTAASAAVVANAKSVTEVKPVLFKMMNVEKSANRCCHRRF